MTPKIDSVDDLPLTASSKVDGRPFRVSVVVPAFNHADYVGEALRSVFAQEFDGLEIILVDDGSNDGTADLAEALLQGQKIPFQIVRQPNQGAHAAINKGIALARGEWISILNSDDRYIAGRIAQLMGHAINAKSRFVFSRVRFIGPDGNPLPASTPVISYYEYALGLRDVYPTPNFELLRHDYAISTGNYFFHHSLVDEMGPFRDFKICHDWDFILRALLVEEVSYLNEVLYEYRVHSSNTIQPSVKDLRDQETDILISDYLLHAEQASNPLAPSRKNWGRYWDYFLTNQMELLAYLPGVKSALETCLAGPPSDESGIKPHLTSAITQYTRRVEELRNENAKLQAQLAGLPPTGELPPLPARTLFYFWLRKLFYPLYHMLKGSWVRKLKNRFKSTLVAGPK